MFDKENVSRHDLHVSTKSSLNRTKENTRRLRDLAINKKKKKKESTRCRAFPLTRLIVRKARETEISLLGQRGLLEREIFERTRNEHAPIKVFWRGGFARRRGINLRGAKEERKEEERRRLDTCPVFPRNFPLRPGNQFHRTPRPPVTVLFRAVEAINPWRVNGVTAKGEDKFGQRASLRISAPVSITVTRPTRCLFSPRERTLTSRRVN